MNHQVTPSLDIRIDRLVDGELPRDEYRALLLELDREPGGWRLCALAFLEAQALGGELRGIRAAAATHPLSKSDAVVKPASSTPSPGPSGASTWGTTFRWLAVAASWLLVFGLGSYASNWFTPNETPSRSSVSRNDARPTTTPLVRHRAAQPGDMARLEFVGAGDRYPRSVDMPIGAPEELEQLMAAPAPAVSPKLIKAIHGAGHDLQLGERQLVPVVTPSGESLLLPVEQYRIVPVRPAF